MRGTLCLVLATAGTLSAYPLLAGFKEAPYWKMPTQVVPILVGALLLPFFVAALFNFFAAVKITLPATFESRTVRNRLRAFRDRSRKKRGQLPAQK
ncbi:MAG: hypothetical protein EON54_20875 [Alcaligenaceae bacterium]|nr:MAG: hypothetical protein EON54_20875 [Alcaligenaceae bacterium]